MKDFTIKMSDLNRVHDLKTGSLFKWCLSAPFIAKERYDEKLLGRLEECGTVLGQLFQRSDDLLDFDIRNEEGKAVLGDLRSGYLNSFAVWVLRDVPPAIFQKAVLAQSLGEFKGVIGEAHFDQRATEFDVENQRSIDLYFHRLEDLRECLTKDELGVIEDLKTLPKPLYWRKRD